ncbi:MAG: class I SAM-dependent methyltransferase [Gemmataceae bacterium]|nr:class I SAM-dependent methyltransferase [Gemmataceae bacterium]
MNRSNPWGESPEWREGLPPEITVHDAAVLRRLVAQAARGGMAAAEVGSWVGNGSTRVLAEAVRPHGGTLWCIDTWQGSDNVPHHQECRERWGTMFPVFAANVRSYGGQEAVRPLAMPSLDACRLFPDQSLDLVFIDGNHGYSHARADILAWLPKVRPGGILCGHDCDADWAALDPRLKADLGHGREEDTYKNTRWPGPPEFHAGVVQALHDVLGGRARLWLPDHSTVWSFRKPGGLLRRFLTWLGRPAPSVGDGPMRAASPWPAAEAARAR